jgi:hypothetical protein
VKTLQAKFLDWRLEIVMALRSQLRPDQWAKWFELRQSMDYRRRSWGRGIAF